MRSLSLFLLFVRRNCLFRALGDQLEGHSRGHLRLRQETVQYMSSHRQDFEPFVEDDVPFAQHCEKMTRSEIQTRSRTERKACDQIRGLAIAVKQIHNDFCEWKVLWYQWEIILTNNYVLTPGGQSICSQWTYWTCFPNCEPLRQNRI